MLLTHGWSWSFWDFKDTIGPLSRLEDYGGDVGDTFNVYVVSLPGYGFSVPVATPGVDVVKVAELWAKLMTEVLGFDQFCAPGGDWGGLVIAHLAHAHVDKLLGAHLSTALIPGINRRALQPDEQWMIDRNAEAEPLVGSHVTVHLLDPQTLSCGLMDSPVRTARGFGSAGATGATAMASRSLTESTCAARRSCSGLLARSRHR